MGEIAPGVAVLAVILADRAPLPLAEIGTPLLPRDSRLAGVIQPLLFHGVNYFFLCHDSLSFRYFPFTLPCALINRPIFLLQPYLTILFCGSISRLSR